MNIITRAEWGARVPDFQRPIDLKGPSTVHWNGGGTKWNSIADDDDARKRWGINRMRAIQNFHMDGRGWSDFAYNFAIDPWGLNVFEGRGLDVRPAAQGTTDGNNTSHAIYVMTGLGDPDVTEDCLVLLNEVADYIADKGTADPMVVGHRDWKSTTCPGDFLYNALAKLNDPNYGGYDHREPIPIRSNVIAMFFLEGGYGMVDETGRVRVRGKVDHVGDLRDVSLNAPIVDGESTPSGKGYYLASADGGVFAFGDAPYHGSLGDMTLNAPIVGIEVEEGGYWLLAEDGGVFTFGSLPFVGSFVGV